MPKRRILIVAGDPSADRHAAQVVEDLRQREPDLWITALGGPRLKSCADSFVFPLVGVGGFGFWEPLFKLPQLWKAWRTALHTLKEGPDLVFLVDYYGFNIHVARAAQRRSIPVVYYISPQVWASRPRRIQKLHDTINRMLVIFPFEVPLYEKAGIPVTFVGHPLVQKIPRVPDTNQGKRVGLMPGSRPTVIERHLPILGGAAELIKKQIPEMDFILFRPEEVSESLYRSFQEAYPWIKVITDPGYEQRKTISLAITVSGTASLENTLLGIPMVVMYRLSPVTYQVAKHLIRVPYVAIPNILAGRPIVPELLQDKATAEKLAEAGVKLLREPERWAAMRRDLLSLRDLLTGNTVTAAEEVLKELNRGIPGESPLTPARRAATLR